MLLKMGHKHMLYEMYYYVTEHDDISFTLDHDFFPEKCRIYFNISINSFHDPKRK